MPDEERLEKLIEQQRVKTDELKDFINDKIDNVRDDVNKLRIDSMEGDANVTSSIYREINESQEKCPYISKINELIDKIKEIENLKMKFILWISGAAVTTLVNVVFFLIQLLSRKP